MNMFKPSAMLPIASVAAVATLCLLFSSPSEARSIHSSISLGEFERRCAAYGGEGRPRSGGFICILNDGTAIQCFKESSGGINCDVLKKQGGKKPSRLVPKILGTVNQGGNGQGNQVGSGSGGDGGGSGSNVGGAAPGGPVKGSGGGCSGGVC